MSTSKPEGLEAALSQIPTAFRHRLIETYVKLRSAYLEGQFDAAGLRAGVLAEILLRFLQEHLTGAHTRFGTKIQNFADECRSLEKLPRTAGPESLRVIMPRALGYMYTLRNKRGIGHVGGEVDANEIDAATCVRLADWCVCELIRVFGTSSLEESQALIDSIAVL